MALTNDNNERPSALTAKGPNHHHHHQTFIFDFLKLIYNGGYKVNNHDYMRNCHQYSFLTNCQLCFSKFEFENMIVFYLIIHEKKVQFFLIGLHNHMFAFKWIS